MHAIIYGFCLVKCRSGIQVACLTSACLWLPACDWWYSFLAALILITRVSTRNGQSVSKRLCMVLDHSFSSCLMPSGLHRSVVFIVKLCWCQYQIVWYRNRNRARPGTKLATMNQMELELLPRWTPTWSNLCVRYNKYVRTNTRATARQVSASLRIIINKFKCVKGYIIGYE